jgi:hypothetical protein
MFLLRHQFEFLFLRGLLRRGYACAKAQKRFSSDKPVKTFLEGIKAVNQRANTGNKRG